MSTFGAAGAPCETEFQHVLVGPELDRRVFVSPTTDGGYIVAGVTTSFGASG